MALASWTADSCAATVKGTILLYGLLGGPLIGLLEFVEDRVILAERPLASFLPDVERRASESTSRAARLARPQLASILWSDENGTGGGGTARAFPSGR